MFLILHLMGRTAAKVIATAVVVFACPFLPGKGRRLRLYLNFAWSLVDKSAACAGFGRAPEFLYEGDENWKRGGCFLLSTHVGCIEVLPFAAEKGSPVVHAFQQLTHNGVFTREFLRHLDPERLALHAVEEIGVETAVEMKEAIERGEIVLMAGDRVSAQSGRKGVFRFAKLMECPVYAITCVARGWKGYVVNAARMGENLEEDYDRFRAEAAAKYPEQVYDFQGNN